MSHAVGDQVIPFATEKPAGAGFLSTLVEDIAKLFREQAGDAWSDETHGEDVVQRTWTRDPHSGDFEPGDLPSLYLWASGVPSRQRLTDSIRLETTELSLIWVPSLVVDHHAHDRSSFWTALDKLLDLAINTDWFSVHTTTDGWGKSLQANAGLWKLTIGAGRPATIHVESGEITAEYQGYQWSMMATTEMVPDFLVNSPAVPAAQTTQITTSKADGEPVIVLAETQYPRP